jgi:hypothetical protein
VARILGTHLHHHPIEQLDPFVLIAAKLHQALVFHAFEGANLCGI